VRPSALSAAKLDSDQAVPLLSHLSCVDHIGVDAAAGLATAVAIGLATGLAIGGAAPAMGTGATTSAPTMTRTPMTDFFVNIITFRLSWQAEERRNTAHRS